VREGEDRQNGNGELGRRGKEREETARTNL